MEDQLQPWTCHEFLRLQAELVEARAQVAAYLIADLGVSAWVAGWARGLL